MNAHPIVDPLIRHVAAWYDKRCSSCATIRIETLVREPTNTCRACRRGQTISMLLLKTMAMTMGVPLKELREFATDAESMAIMVALARGVHAHGIRAFRSGFPVYAVFDITNHCNLHCIHCYSEDTQTDLETNEVFGVLKQLSDTGVGVIDFGGGEPLLRPDIFDILQYSKKLGMYTSMTTNGTMLDQATARRLKDARIDHVCVSLDGASPQVHDYIRGTNGAFDNAIAAITTCKACKIPIQVSTVVMRRNMSDLVALSSLLASMQVDGWYMYDFVPAGRGAGLQNEVLSEEQRRHVLECLLGIEPTFPGQIKPYPYLITRNAADQQTSFFNKYGRLTQLFKGCLSGRWTCHVSNNGDLHPCFLLPSRLGNLTHESIDSIWFNPENAVLRTLRNRRLLKGDCGQCRHRDVCGGCRAQAYWKTGSYLDSDSCWITRSNPST